MTEKEKDITTELEEYKKKGCNLLMPSTHIAGLSEYHQPVIETVLLSSNPDNGDVYPHDGAEAGPNKKWRPTKQALMKLSVCAGVIWSPTATRRSDNGASRDYIAYKAVGGIKKADGQPVFFSAEYDLDFEIMKDELTEQYKKKAEAKDKQGNYYKKTEKERQEYVDFCVSRDLIQKRKHKLKLCEAGAMNRVLRMLLGLKQAYTTTELSRPFVMARIVFRPDFTDAAVRKQFVDASIRSMVGIYGPEALDKEIHKSEPIDITALPDEPDTTKEPTPLESAIIDFSNSDELGQCTMLTTVVHLKGYDLSGYLTRANLKDLTVIPKEKRVDLFKHILSLAEPEAKAAQQGE